jgi:hypothetical protein
VLTADPGTDLLDEPTGVRPSSLHRRRREYVVDATRSGLVNEAERPDFEVVA